MRKHQARSFAIAQFVFFVCVQSIVWGQPARLTSIDLFNMQYAVDPQISPDGQRIIYVRRFSDIMSDKTYSNLWIINPDGKENRPLTTGNFTDSSPRWSPDGNRIIYLSDRDGKPQIYLRWMDTGQTTQLTHLQFSPSGIGWSPDGKQVSFLSLVPVPPPQIGKLPTAPQGAKWAEPAKIINRLVYRFNGVGYLPSGFTQLFVLPADGGTPRQISQGDYNLAGFGFGGSAPVWSPDGKFLILSANRRPDSEFEPLDTEVYEYSVADGTVKALTHRKGPDNAPAISPDGQHIAYTGFDDKYQGYQVTYLYIMNRDGSEPRLLTGDLDRSVGDPHWAPDGSGVYFLYDDQGDSKLGFTSLDGRRKVIAEHLGSGGSSYGGGDGYSIAPNGTFAITTTTTEDPGEIAVGVIGKSAPHEITHVNEGLLSQKTLGKVEEIWYTSSVDNRKIEGWIIKPPDFDPSKKYPLILEIHGGPFADYGDRFDIEKQIMAAHGYVVLYVNPRGSTSYGHEFGNLIHYAYPGDDFYDLNSGVDAVIAKGYVDPNNLFVTGGSGGGVLTCWMVDRTNRFRAAASLYPVINWYSFNLTTDIAPMVMKYWFPGFPWDNLDHYMKRSVISLVKNVKTPTMLMTGEADYRTPISEAEQYYEALKFQKVDAVLVRVPEEPHGISRRPSHHMAKVQYILNWFDEHRTQ